MPRDYHFTTYFMYGTQVLNSPHFDRQFSSCRPEGQGLLKGWRMDFSGPSGQPNLVPDADSQASGLAWLIEEAEVPKLDAIETGYHRQEGSCLWRGKLEPVIFYTAPPGAATPSQEFIGKLREAYKVALLPQAQIDQALAAAARR
jgi:hypothetical protein